MTNEQDKTIEALQTAIQMEIDGKNFYIKAANDSNNEPGRKLLAQLAEEEDIHRKVFIKIFDSIRQKKGWPIVDFKPDGGQGIRTVFAEAMENAKTEKRNLTSELNTVTVARQMEGRTYDFYIRSSQAASESAEKEFYGMLASQEQAHNLALADYYEYLENPAGWFVKKEHPSLE
jgi:rubrerythrin